jgi:hypothetical protein
MSIKILAPIGLGELVDKISILNIKLKYATSNSDQFCNISIEQKELLALLNQHEFVNDLTFVQLQKQLDKINEYIWRLEDQIREHILNNEYGPTFISIARDIPITNDNRCAVKKEINQKFNSFIIEEKIY